MFSGLAKTSISGAATVAATARMHLPGVAEQADPSCKAGQSHVRFRAMPMQSKGAAQGRNRARLALTSPIGCV
jgi:hypothetical protein